MSARRVGRYLMFDAFASGGMASIHFGRLTGASGFARLVVLKRLHPQFARDAEFVAMFTDEARVSARVQHPNVVGVHDVVQDGDEILLVMDYVHGEPLSKLIRVARDRDEKVPPRIAAAIVAQALTGLHAAHEARGEGGKPLEIVHRDVSPQNILVGADGVARVVDFGVAKALGRSQHTAEGNMKGKIRYFAPEQLTNDVDRRTDVFAAGVVLWETLRAERLFTGDTQWEVIQGVLSREIPRPSEDDPEIPEALSDALMKALVRERADRWPTARAMATAIERAGVASTGEIAEWMEGLVAEDLEARRGRITALEGLEDLAPPPSIRMTTSRGDEAAPAKRGAAEPSATTDEPSAKSGITSAPSAKTAIEEATPAAQRGGALAARPFPWVAVIGVVLGVAGLAFGLGVALRREPAPPATPQLLDDRASATSSSTPPPREAPSSAPTSVPTPSAVLAPPTASARSSGTATVASVTAPTPKPIKAGRPCEATLDCGESYVCAEGRCTCNGEFCGGACVDTFRDRMHCGGCGIRCKDDEYCSGACLKCTGAFFTMCSGRCVDTRLNPNCGACGVMCMLPTQCNGGRCQ